MSDSDELQAYRIEFGPCATVVVVAAKTPMEAVDHALAKWNADDARGGSDPLTHRDLERLEALGPFEGIAAHGDEPPLSSTDASRLGSTGWSQWSDNVRPAPAIEHEVEGRIRRSASTADGIERMIEDASRQLVEALRALGVKVR